MSKVERRILNISLEYSDINEVQTALQRMVDNIKHGKRYERVTYYSSIIEWSSVKADEMNYREEVINGKLCHVYQSKINKPRKS